MKVMLTREDYEKSKDLFKTQYIIWDSTKNNFINTSKKGYKFTITAIENMANEKRDKLIKVLSNWKCAIKEKDLKNTNDYKSPSVPKQLYNGVANSMEDYFYELKKNSSTRKNYFCSTIKHKSNYLSIGIFSMPIDKKSISAMLEFSLAYPESQDMKEKRKDGAFGACGHNSRIKMIKHIFSHKNINEIHSIPINYAAGKALEKLGFKP